MLQVNQLRAFGARRSKAAPVIEALAHRNSPNTANDLKHFCPKTSLFDR